MGYRTSGCRAAGWETGDRFAREDGAGAAPRDQWGVEGEAGDVEPGAEGVSAWYPTVSPRAQKMKRNQLRLRPLRETPAGGGFGEICGVLVLAEGCFGFDAINVAAGS